MNAGMGFVSKVRTDVPLGTAGNHKSNEKNVLDELGECVQQQFPRSWMSALVQCIYDNHQLLDGREIDRG